jgi:hypothetical protein
MTGGPPSIAFADWQCAADYAPLLDMDRAGLAWEWLRRSADYQAAWRASAYQSIMRNANPAITVVDGQPAADVALARLHFCRKSIGKGGSGPLVLVR